MGNLVPLKKRKRKKEKKTMNTMTVSTMMRTGSSSGAKRARIGSSTTTRTNRRMKPGKPKSILKPLTLLKWWIPSWTNHSPRLQRPQG